METTISEIRAIVQRRRDIAIEDERLHQRFLELLPKAGKAFFADVKRKSHERSKAR